MIETSPFAATDLLPFALSYALLAMLPGPNFAVVAQAGLTSCRNTALAAAIGIALGASLLSGVIAGSAGALPLSPAGAHLAAVLYGVFLLWLGARAIDRAIRPSALLARETRIPATGYFRLAFMTAMANPASALFFTSSALAAKTSAQSSSLIVFLVAAIWFGLVGLALSASACRAFYVRYRRHADVALGTALAAMGMAAMF
ncbi:LysE family transporter [Corticibacterium sp. UT-5YL-CI-8]|nr:LysE family transporter [Tianweitania sp. UT-5YL-CI-8]